MPNVKLVSLRLVRERSLTYEKGLTGPAAAAALITKLLEDMDREHFVCVYLDSRHRPIGVEVSAVGTASECLVSPGVVFRGALLVAATAVCFGHNHPSGDPSPSPEDFNLTSALIGAGKLLGIRVVDHMVIGHDRWVSIREMKPEMGWS